MEESYPYQNGTGCTYVLWDPDEQCESPGVSPSGPPDQFLGSDGPKPPIGYSGADPTASFHYVTRLQSHTW